MDFEVKDIMVICGIGLLGSFILCTIIEAIGFVTLISKLVALFGGFLFGCMVGAIIRYKAYRNEHKNDFT